MPRAQVHVHKHVRLMMCSPPGVQCTPAVTVVLRAAEKVVSVGSEREIEAADTLHVIIMTPHVNVLGQIVSIPQV